MILAVKCMLEHLPNFAQIRCHFNLKFMLLTVVVVVVE